MSIGASSIQTGTLLLAAATFFGALVGSLVNFFKRWLDQRQRRQNLRQALLSEIMELSYISSNTTQSRLDYETAKTLFATAPTDVYDNHVEELGTLTAEEVEAVVHYYGSIKSGEGIVKVQDVDSYENINVSRLEGERQRAIREIKQNL